MKKLVLGAAAVLLVACGGGDEKPTTPTTTTSASAPPPVASTPPVTSASVVTPPPKPPLAELIKKTMADNDAAWAAHDAKKLMTTYADDVQAWGVMPPVGYGAATKAQIEAQMTGFFAAFPDGRNTTTRTFTKGNTVVVESVFSGTNTGEMMGQKGTGKKVSMHSAMVYAFNADGLINQQWLFYDHLTMMGQLGQTDPKMKVRAVEPIPTAPVVNIVAKDSPEEAKNVDIAKAFYMNFEKKDDKGYLGALTDDVQMFDYSGTTDSKGKDAAKKSWTEMMKIFPDAKVTPKLVLGFDNFVVAAVEFNGTMKGAMGPAKPTNKNGNMHLLDIVELKDGKAKTVTTYGSGLEAAIAFGLLPTAPPAGAKPAGNPPPAGSAKPATPPPAGSAKPK
jgi:predicted ester cyclase